VWHRLLQEWGQGIPRFGALLLLHGAGLSSEGVSVGVVSFVVVGFDDIELAAGPISILDTICPVTFLCVFVEYEILVVTVCVGGGSMTAAIGLTMFSILPFGLCCSAECIVFVS